MENHNKQKSKKVHCLNRLLCYFSGDYDLLCPGGPGFKPNPVTVILEGIEFLLCVFSKNRRWIMYWCKYKT